MGYRILYGPAGKTEIEWNRRRGKVRKTVLAGFFVLAVCAAACMIAGKEKLQEVFIPGNPDVTRAAFGKLTEDIQNGESLGDAMAAFCMEIIENAEQVR